MIKSNKISQINTVHGTAWESQKSLNHAHLVCDSCEEISCVTIPQEFLITIIQKISNFNIHKLTINGVCNHCSLN
jgi:Fe2+ or Zn2+ uptake regulation protein